LGILVILSRERPIETRKSPISFEDMLRGTKDPKDYTFRHWSISIERRSAHPEGDSSHKHA